MWTGSCVWDFSARPLDLLQFASVRMAERAVSVVFRVFWDGRGRPRAGPVQDAPPWRGPRAGSLLPTLLLSPARPGPAPAPMAPSMCGQHGPVLPQETAAPGA